MALSRSMKNLMHDAAQARRGGGSHNPNGGGRLGGVMGQYNPGGRTTPRGPMPDRGPRGPVRPTAPSRVSQVMQRFQQQRGGFAGLVGGAGGRNPATGGPGPPQRITMGGLGQRTGDGGMPRGGVMGGRWGAPGGPGRLQPGGPTGGGMMRPAVQPPQRGPGTVAGKPMPRAGTFGFASQGGGGTPAMQAPRPGGLPGAISGPGGKSIAQRISGRQRPPARRGGMARALGSGGSRRRLLR